MANWIASQQKLAAKFKAKGMAVQITKTSAVVFNASTGQTTGGVATPYTFYGFEGKSLGKNVDGKVREFSDEFKGPTDIEYIDATLEVSAQSFDAQGNSSYSISPDVGDTVTYNGNTYSVKTCNPLSPVGVVLMFILELRK